MVDLYIYITVTMSSLLIYALGYGVESIEVPLIGLNSNKKSKPSYQLTIHIFAMENYNRFAEPAAASMFKLRYHTSDCYKA